MDGGLLIAIIGLVIAAFFSAFFVVMSKEQLREQRVSSDSLTKTLLTVGDNLAEGIRASAEVTLGLIAKTAQTAQESMMKLAETTQETIKVEARATREAIRELAFVRGQLEVLVGPTVIHGAGRAGQGLATLVVNKSRCAGMAFDRAELAGFIDDNPDLQANPIRVGTKNVKVLGTSQEIESLISDKLIQSVLIAIGQPEPANRDRVVAACKRAKIPCYDFDNLEISFTRLN
ncbi:MAG: hypothetical protein HYX93_02470 [Chloroflexi bacterium]|nr:hypothetical protein [Chloroflexota bacterium]